jgi:ribose transport system permease protein
VLSTAATPGGTTPVRRWRQLARRNAAVLAIYAVLAMMVGGAAINSPAFRSSDNIFDVLRQSVALGIVSIGQTLVILAGGIDLSVGSMVKLVQLVGAGQINGDSGAMLPWCAALLLLGLFVGTVNGLLVTRLRVAPFIVTLGMYSLLRGAAYGYSSTPLGAIPDPMTNWYNGQWGPVPLPLILLGAVLAATLAALRWTPFGRHMGLPVDRVTVLVFALSGLAAAAAGLIYASRVGLGDPQIGEGLELDSITAVVLGGTSLFGGRGSVLGTLAGVLILSFVGNIMTMEQVSSFYQDLIKGLVIIIAVAIYKQRQ